MDALKSKGQMLDQIDLENIPRSGFDLSYSNKGTAKIGRIVPIRCTETLPSDSYKGSTKIAMQFEPLAVPILSNMRVKHEDWYVPSHILWDEWDKFITKGEDLSDTSVVPNFLLQKVLDLAADIMFDGSNQDIRIVTGHVIYSDGSGVHDANNVYMSLQDIIDFVRNVRDNCPFESPVAQIDDLLDYHKQVCDQFLDYLSDAQAFSVVINTASGYPGSGDVNATFGFQPRFLPMLKMKGAYSYLPMTYADYYEKYGIRGLEGVKDFNVYDNRVGKYFAKDTSKDWFVPSDFATRLCEFIYDLCAPIVGVGSNLDYLSCRYWSIYDSYFSVVKLFNALYRPRVDKQDGSVDPTSVNIVLAGNYSYRSALRWQVFDAPVSVLPLRALYAIWYNNYRDQLLETKQPEPVTATSVTDTELWTLLLPRQRCWSKDTFTTALGNTGTGNMVVPVTESLSGYNQRVTTTGILDAGSVEDLDLGLTKFELSSGKVVELPTRYIRGASSLEGDSVQTQYAFSLDTLRRAGRTEKWIQKALIYGNRIQDALFTHWRVKIKNERIQLPEFVHSNVQMVKIDTIMNNTTIETDQSSTIAGDKAGFASAYSDGSDFELYSPEHGYLISLMSVLPEQTYSVGVARHFGKLSIFDYAFPEFAQIGMDAVYVNEIAQSNVLNDVDMAVFGYQGRYYDYKCKQDEEHGELLTSQDMYTFNRDFNMYDPDARPKLNYRFVHCWPSLDMFVVDDPTQDQFRYDIYHAVACTRALPVCGLSV